MRINKLVLVGIVAVILIFALTGAFFSNKESSSKKSPFVVVPTPPTFQGQPTTSPLVLFTLNKDFALPSVTNWKQYSVPATNYKALADAVVQRITPKSTQTTTASGGDEVTVWAWDTGEASLSISTDQIASFAVTDSSPGNGGILISALPETLSLPSKMTLLPVSPPSQVSGSINFPYDQSLGQVLRSSYSFAYEGYPTLLSGPDEQSLIVFAEANGRVRHLSTILPMGTPTETKTVSTIKTSDVLFNLNQNRGLFVTSDINGIWENDNPIRFNKVTIKSARPARLFNRNTRTLDPVFILDGEGVTATETKIVRYILMGFSQ